MSDDRNLKDALSRLADEYGWAAIGTALVEMLRPRLEAERDRLSTSDEDPA